MPKLYLGEYSELGASGRGVIPFPQEPPIGEQSIDIGLTSTSSETLLDEAVIIRLVAEEDCAIAIGVDPDATTSVRFVPAGKEQLLTVAAGSKMKIAVVAAGSGGGSGFDSLGALLRVVTAPADVQKAMETLAAQTTKANDARKALKDATAANASSADAAAEAARRADKAKIDAEQAATAATAKLDQLALETAVYSDRAKAEEEAAAARKSELDKKASELNSLKASLEKSAQSLLDSKTDLDKKTSDLAIQQAAAQALAAEYDAKLAKLKALTG